MCLYRLRRASTMCLQLSAFVPFSGWGPGLPLWPSSIMLVSACVLPQHAPAHHRHLTCPATSGFSGFDGTVNNAPARWWIQSKFWMYRCPTCKIQRASEWCHYFCKEDRGLAGLTPSNLQWGEGAPLREALLWPMVPEDLNFGHTSSQSSFALKITVSLNSGKMCKVPLQRSVLHKEWNKNWHSGAYKYGLGTLQLT